MRLCHQFTAELHGAFSLNEMWKILSGVLQLFSKSSLCVQGSSCESVLARTSFHPHGSGLDVSWVWGLLENEPCWQYVSWFEGAYTMGLLTQIFPCSLSMKPAFTTSERNYIGAIQYSFNICTRRQDPKIVSKSPVLPVVDISSRWKRIIDTLGLLVLNWIKDKTKFRCSKLCQTLWHWQICLTALWTAWRFL